MSSERIYPSAVHRDADAKIRYDALIAACLSVGDDGSSTSVIVERARGFEAYLRGDR